ncbi:hypothetical protein R84981_002764 [Carnimonas sp. R-84981]|uniref:hypothetical protein n=1 Tax=Carnimonas bestiolae TaxID=3402172 RepID=UPI003EDC5942
MALTLSSSAFIPDAEEWLDIDDETSILVLSAALPEFQARLGYLNRHTDELGSKAGLGTETFDPESPALTFDRTVELQKLIARHLVKSWKGVKDDKGQEAKATPDNVMALFEAYPYVSTMVWQKASQIAVKLDQQREETVGKSGNSQNGSKNQS